MARELKLKLHTCDACGDLADTESHVKLLERGWRSFQVTGEGDEGPWKDIVVACDLCAPSVEIGRAVIRTFGSGVRQQPRLVA